MASPFSGREGRLAAIYQARQLENAQNDLGTAEARSIAELGSGYMKARDAYQPIIDLYGKGANLAADAYGLNGPEGLARARTAFQAGPGYNFARDEALQAAERGASAGGQLASGNLLTTLQDRATGLANQEYNNWRTGVSSYTPLYGQVGTRLGDIGYGLGKDTAGVIGDIAGQRAGLTSQIGQVGAAGLQAGQNAAANRLNFGMQLGNTIAGIGLGAFGKGGMFGSGGAFAPGGRFA